MSKHTPGPWIIGKTYSTLAPDRYVETLLLSVKLEHVATGVGAKPEESEANARLIAAAPDLLEALKGILSAAELHGADSVEYFDARNAGLNAVAKVEAEHARPE